MRKFFGTKCGLRRTISAALVLTLILSSFLVTVSFANEDEQGKTDVKASRAIQGVSTFGMGVGTSLSDALSNMKKNQKSVAFGTGASASGSKEASGGPGERLSGSDEGLNDANAASGNETTTSAIGDNSADSTDATTNSGIDGASDELSSSGIDGSDGMSGMISKMMSMMMDMIKKMFTSEMGDLMNGTDKAGASADVNNPSVEAEGADEQPTDDSTNAGAEDVQTPEAPTAGE